MMSAVIGRYQVQIVAIRAGVVVRRMACAAIARAWIKLRSMGAGKGDKVEGTVTFCRNGRIQWLPITVTADSHHGQQAVVAPSRLRMTTTRVRVHVTYRRPTGTLEQSTRIPRNLACTAMSLP